MELRAHLMEDLEQRNPPLDPLERRNLLTKLVLTEDQVQRILPLINQAVMKALIQRNLHINPGLLAEQGQRSLLLISRDLTEDQAQRILPLINQVVMEVLAQRNLLTNPGLTEEQVHRRLPPISRDLTEDQAQRILPLINQVVMEVLAQRNLLTNPGLTEEQVHRRLPPISRDLTEDQAQRILPLINQVVMEVLAQRNLLTNPGLSAEQGLPSPRIQTDLVEVLLAQATKLHWTGNLVVQVIAQVEIKIAAAEADVAGLIVDPRILNLAIKPACPALRRMLDLWEAPMPTRTSSCKVLKAVFPEEVEAFNHRAELESVDQVS